MLHTQLNLVSVGDESKPAEYETMKTLIEELGMNLEIMSDMLDDGDDIPTLSQILKKVS